jgi:hypothetical protein
MQWIAGEECVLQGSEDRELRVWDARTQSVVQRLNFEGHFSVLTIPCPSPAPAPAPAPCF